MIELFAQMRQAANNPAFQVGMIVGIVLAVVLSAGIPLSLGIGRGQPVVGVIGAVCSGGMAVILGCLGGLSVRRDHSRPWRPEEEKEEEETSTQR